MTPKDTQLWSVPQLDLASSGSGRGAGPHTDVGKARPAMWDPARDT